MIVGIDLHRDGTLTVRRLVATTRELPIYTWESGSFPAAYVTTPDYDIVEEIITDAEAILELKRTEWRKISPVLHGSSDGTADGTA